MEIIRSNQLMAMDRIKITTSIEKVAELLNEPLTALQEVVLEGILLDWTYQEIADKNNFNCGTAKNIGSELNQRLSSELGKRVTKRNIREILEELCSSPRVLPTKTYDVDKSLNQDQEELAEDFTFYLERQWDSIACKQLLKPNAVVRIIAPEKMGKSLLLKNILNKLSSSTYGVEIDLCLPDNHNYENANNFFKWFCCFVSRKLDRKLRLKQEFENNWNEYLENEWEDDFGGKTNADFYFEECLLPRIDLPLILAFDNLRYLFRHQNTAIDVLQLLRAWHEAKKLPKSQISQKLRLLLAYRENPLSLNTEHSPFNVGKSVQLSEFNVQEVLNLSHKYQLSLCEEKAKKLISVTKNGHPYLITEIFKELKTNSITLESFLQSGFREKEPYNRFM